MKLLQRIPKLHINQEKKARIIAVFNRYSLFIHVLLSMVLCFTIEAISRHSVLKALSFFGGHTLAFVYNSFIIFASLSLVYLIRRRAFLRIIICGFWLFLGTINGCILSNRVTPFGYTDLKCINDLLSMQNTNYFTAQEATLVVCVTALFFIFCTYMFIKGPKFQGERKKILTPCLVGFCFLMLPVTTQAAQNSNILASYFANIAQGYENYGFVYGFSTSVIDRGMARPKGYSEDSVTAAQQVSKKEATANEANPNIVVVLLESFIDPTEVNFLNFSKDPIPNFRKLSNDFSSGYLTVPVVGAGTANTEFEILTGMSMQYFGTGEYPYKTILKQTDCESIASNLSKIGYGTHVVHNNGGNFYSRAKVFNNIGFDSYTSKEFMNILQLTENGWAKDDILIEHILNAMDTTEQQDFVFGISVQGHGDYPEEKLIENPRITVEGIGDEATKNKWEYYVNQVYEMDQFAGNLVKAIEERGEPSVIVFYGDHLPTMGLEAEDLKSRYLYNTNYVIWDNIGLKKEDKNIPAYQIMAEVFKRLDIHSGTVFNYHQEREKTKNYLADLELLQYDILYGEQYVYDGDPPITEGHMAMGVKDVALTGIFPLLEEGYSLYGENFTKQSRVFVNEEKQKSTFLNNTRIVLPETALSDGDVITVVQMGSSNTVFRTSNQYLWQEGELKVIEGTGTDPDKSWTVQTGEQE